MCVVYTVQILYITLIMFLTKCVCVVQYAHAKHSHIIFVWHELQIVCRMCAHFAFNYPTLSPSSPHTHTRTRTHTHTHTHTHNTHTHTHTHHTHTLTAVLAGSNLSHYLLGVQSQVPDLWVLLYLLPLVRREETTVLLLGVLRGERETLWLPPVMRGIVF